MRKSITLTSKLCNEYSLSGWRQVSYNLARLKSHWRKAQRSNRSRQKDAQEKKKKAHKSYLRVANQYLERTLDSIQQLQEKVGPQLSPEAWSYLQNELEKISVFQEYAEILINQIERRVLEEERIPTEEKIYSVFQPHTEWISKGKAGVPVELGLKVCIIEDQYQFILHHQVMEKKQDVDVAVSMVTEVQAQFPEFKACSFDKGFHSPENQKELAKNLDQVVLPKKGRMSPGDKIKAAESNYKAARRQHSAVESAINALEQHGLDRCPDHGIDGFKRYVALSILSRNLQRIGAMLTEKERDDLKRNRSRKPFCKAA